LRGLFLSRLYYVAYNFLAKMKPYKIWSSI
jgi:hypothetical protein